MGIYDRDYSRDYEPGFRIAAPKTATLQLLIITIGVYILQLLFPPLTDFLKLSSNWWTRPWTAYELLTYGFAHDPRDVTHILFNMLVLGIFGTHIEQRYGRQRFVFFYLSAIVVGGLGYTLTSLLAGGNGFVFGASGATTAIFILFALNFPHVQIQMMFIFPMPAWVAALIGVGLDAQGVIARLGVIAFTVHLSGAAYALYYYYHGAEATNWLTEKLSGISLRPKPKLRVHDPDDEDRDDLNQQVDRILEKIQQQGQDSLTWRERRTLEKASKQYQEKRR